MCCEECPKYEECEENNRLKDNCCSKCPEYDNCVGGEDGKKDRFGDSFRDRDTDTEDCF